MISASGIGPSAARLRAAGHLDRQLWLTVHNCTNQGKINIVYSPTGPVDTVHIPTVGVTACYYGVAVYAGLEGGFSVHFLPVVFRYNRCLDDWAATASPDDTKTGGSHPYGLLDGWSVRVSSRHSRLLNNTNGKE
jgi:hypothetical protein